MDVVCESTRVQRGKQNLTFTCRWSTLVASEWSLWTASVQSCPAMLIWADSEWASCSFLFYQVCINKLFKSARITKGAYTIVSTRTIVRYNPPWACLLLFFLIQISKCLYHSQWKYMTYFHFSRAKAPWLWSYVWTFSNKSPTKGAISIIINYRTLASRKKNDVFLSDKRHRRNRIISLSGGWIDRMSHLMVHLAVTRPCHCVVRLHLF